MTISQVFNITMEVWGILFCLMAAVATVVGGYRNEKDQKLERLIMIITFLLTFDVMQWIYQGDLTTTGYYATRVSNFVEFILTFTLIVFFADYVCSFVDQNRMTRIFMWTSRILTFIGYGMVLVNIYTGDFYYFDEDNYYYRGPLSNWIWVIGFVALVFTLILLLHKRKEFSTGHFVAFCCYVFLPLVSVMIQANVYGVSLINISFTITLLIVFLVNVAERGREFAKYEHHMNEMQTKIMLSQIQPHFLYNSLTAIYYLCDENPAKARDAISDFSHYLRANMDSLKKMEPVSFEEELKHVKTYLNLEILRFEEDLNVEYDIQETDFKLPALSVQPVVENAVKYGVGKKVGGGTVRITTSQEAKYYRIDVIDDGIGFDVMETKDDGRTHIGIDNVRNRLLNMVGGSLEIHSVLGEGTQATIRIPK